MERNLQNVLAVFSVAQLVQLAERVSEIQSNPGHGSVTIVVKEGYVRYMEVKISENITKD